MNNGAFGENFPYSNFHDLNMDWIIKIAKDFLDQYTNIQETISNGETEITELTATKISELTNTADELTTALNSWYDEHQGYLDQYVIDSISEVQSRIAELMATIPEDFNTVIAEIDELETASQKAYVAVTQTVESGVKNKFDPDNWADVNYHVLVDVKEGEKYLIAGQGVNVNYPLYVIYNSTEILEADQSTTFSYISAQEITIPAGASKLAVNSQYEDQPFVRKLENVATSEYLGTNQNIDNVPEYRKNEYTKLVYTVLPGMYKVSPINSKSTGSNRGYHVLLTVNPGEQYRLTCSGNANYPKWITYDKNMTPIDNGGSGLSADLDITIPANCKYIRVQNNLGDDIRIKKKLRNNMNNAIWLGDSYTQANSLGADQDKRFSTLVSNRLFCNEFNFAVGGNGLFATTTYPDNFRRQIQNAATAQTLTERTLTKYIIICGGRNDPYTSPNKTQQDFDDATEELFTFINQWYPDADVIVFPYLWDATQMGNTYYQYYLKFINSLKKQKCRIITNCYTWLTGYFDYILSDNVHPNVNGHARLTDFVYNSIVKSDIINEDYIRVPATSEYMPNWTTFTMNIINSDILLSQCSFNVTSDTPANTVIFEQDYGTSKNYPCFTGWLGGIPIMAINRQTGAQYAVTIKYDETDTDHNKLQIITTGTLPAGVYLTNWCMKFGIGY